MDVHMEQSMHYHSLDIEKMEVDGLCFHSLVVVTVATLMVMD